MTADRFDTSHFTLHGLWPQPRSNAHCNVPSNLVQLDKDRQWGDLPALALSAATRRELMQVMPGTQSHLHRHEWIKHGTCYNGETADKYYQDSLQLMRALNASAVRELFAANIGRAINTTDIRERFDAAFGPGAGNRVRVSCTNDGNRKLIIELTIGLKGTVDDHAEVGRLILGAPSTGSGCEGGIVDPSGLQ